MNTDQSYLRSIIFGITDSLVSTVGLLAGIDVAGAPHQTVILTGFVYAFVEAFSMAVGNFLSEESVAEYAARQDVSEKGPIRAGALMFISFVIASIVPLAPYLFLPDPYALPASVLFSVVLLFITGIVSARMAKLPLVSRGLRMAILGGLAIIVGVLVGLLVPAA